MLTIDTKMVMIQTLIDEIIQGHFHFKDGLTTDLEFLRRVMYDTENLYWQLAACCTCGAPYTLQHEESYKGVFCPKCNPDKRRYIIAYGQDNRDKQPELLLYHQVRMHEEMDLHEMKKVDELSVGDRMVIGKEEVVAFLMRVA